MRTTTFASPFTVSLVPVAIGASSNAFSGSQSIRAGVNDIAVQVVSSDESVVQVVGAPVIFRGGDSAQPVTVQPVAPGSALVSLVTPDGFSGTADQAQLRVVVTAPLLSVSINDSMVGKDLQTTGSISLPVQPKDPVSITISSSDPSKVLLSTSRSDGGSASITLPRVSGFSNQFFVNGLADQGTAVLTATVPGFQAATKNVTLAPSGFVLATSFGSNTFNTTSLSPPTALTIAPAVLASSTLAFSGQQSLRGGLQVSVAVVSSDTQVAAIAGSPVVFSGGDGSKTVDFRPLVSGSTIVSVTPPAGFSTPSSMRQLLASVTSAGIMLSVRPVGKNLQAALSFRLSAPAPTGGLTVTLTSADATRVLLSSSARTPGTASTTVNVIAGSSDGTFYAHGLVDSGASQVTASASGFNNGSADVLLNPSGFAFTFPRDIVTSVTGGNTFLNVGAYRLDPQTLNPMEEMDLRAGLAVSVDVTSSDPSVGAVTSSPLLFSGGDREKSTQIRPLTVGTTTLRVGVPGGFVQPGSGGAETVTVR